MIKIKKIIIMTFFMLLLICGITLNNNIYARSEKKVILGGDTIGLRLNTGIYVAGLYQVETNNGKISPWKNSDIKEGDKIVKYDGNNISTNNELLNLLKQEDDNNVKLTLIRDKETINTNIDVVITKNNYKSIGLYIKDKIQGIGTLTFIDPNTSKFASLGHAIYDDNLVIGAQAGIISESSIEGIKKGISGEAGEKRATLSNVILGTISSNKVTGVYGKVKNEKLLDGKLIETASQNEVKKGPAKIYTVIKNNTIESFDIKITGVLLQESTNVKGIKFEVVDKELLDKTGGIIQGMSGSPIVQNNKLVGAVSHVSIEEPNIGYGVHIEWMLSDL